MPLNGVLEGREKLSTTFWMLHSPSDLLASFQDAFRELKMFRGDPVVSPPANVFPPFGRRSNLQVIKPGALLFELSTNGTEWEKPASSTTSSPSPPGTFWSIH